MITVRDRRTGDLIDRGSELGDKRRRLLDCSWSRVFREPLLDDLLIDELLPQFDDRLGRPLRDLHIVIGVLLLQQRHDHRAAATVEALAFNMTAFAAAIEMLFADPNIGAEAIYTSDGGAPVLVCAVARRADAVSEFGDTRLWSETTRIDLRVAEVPNPRLWPPRLRFLLPWRLQPALWRRP